MLDRIPNDLGNFADFKKVWGDAGIRAEVRFDPDAPYKYSAALFPPSELQRYREAAENRFNTFHALEGANRHTFSEAPVSYLNASRKNWAVGPTALVACVKAVDIAAELYPEEIPTNPTGLQKLIALRNVGIVPIAATTSPSYFHVTLEPAKILTRS